MRFSVLAASFMVSAVLAHETETSYITEIHTKTQCAASITNCPARSTVYSTTSYPAPPATSSPSGPVVYYNTSSVAVPPPSTYLPSAPPATTPVAPPATSTPGGPLSSPPFSLSTITISTCVPTVIYSTITVTPSPPAPTSSPVGTIGGSTGTISVPHNVTAPTAPASPSGYETSGASAIQGSVVVAALAGLAAFLFA